MNYFDHPYCSNSRLNQMGVELGILPAIGGDPYNNFRMGSLFDAVVTEPDKLDLIKNEIIGTDYGFTTDEYRKCKEMKRSLEQNNLYQVFCSNGPIFQHEIFYEKFDFGEFKLNMKAKLDFYVPATVADLKSTDARSQKAFKDSCTMFGYYRQMWLYCNLTKSDRAILFAVSKHRPYNVFTVIIKKGDENWNTAAEQVKELAFKYYMTYEK